MSVVVCAALAAVVVGAPYPTPNPIHNADGLTRELNSTANGRLLQLDTTDGVSMKVGGLWCLLGD